MGKKSERLPIERIQAACSTGLTQQEVDERLAKGYGNNTTDVNQKSTASIIFGNLFTFFNTILFSIAAVFIFMIIYFNAIGRSDIVGQYFGISKFIFVVPALMNVTMGTAQEIHSLKVIKKLRIVTSTKSRVIREGNVEKIDASGIVIDDIVVLGAGDQATADVQVIEGEVSVDESMLTGESDYIKKKPGDTILSGSAIIVGDAKARVAEVGDETYVSKLSKKVKGAARHKSELMTTIMKILKILSVMLLIALTVVITTLVIKVSRTGADASIWGRELALSDPVTWALIILTGGSFGIGIIPSGLVLTTSVALVISIAQLSKKQTLVQELYSLENLSRVDVICLDKTGTLTDGTMSVSDVKAFAPMELIEKHMRDLMGMAGDRNATAEAIFQRFGSSEIVEFSEKIPFSSATKCSGLVYKDGSKLLMGAPEYLLPENDTRLQFSADCAKDGKRVIALTLSGNLEAFIVIEDHIRETAPDTLKFFRENGVTVKVISGDNPLTVSRIAELCGIENSDRYISLAGVPLEEIPDIAEKYTIFARVSPEQKEALVKALQSCGHKVAMTGDGVNDILALRRSDSSITFAKATEAAKSCSDVVLLDNDFSHLKAVVGEGRRVIGNIQKASVLYLMKAFAVFLLSFGLIPLSKGQMWFSVENVYMLEAAVIGTGGFLLSMEPRRNPIVGSFMKNIISRSIAAGLLAAVALLLPILANIIPKSAGAAPFIMDENVGTMMTVMMTIAGIVVIFATCIPFNKYRTIALTAVTGVAALLGLMLPSAYIGGRTIGSDLLSYNKAAGESVFQAQLFKEMFHPMKSAVVQNLIIDQNVFLLLRIFLYVAIPAFVLAMFAAENYARKEFKDLKKNRVYRIGRRLMLASGFILIIWSIVAVLQLIRTKRALYKFSSIADSTRSAVGLNITLTIIHILLFFVIGFIGYRLWKNPTKRNIKIAFAAGMTLLVLTVFSIIFSNASIANTQGLLDTVDRIEILIITIMYVAGSIIVRANYKLGLLKPRD
ncbi:MAG: HAD-IC family P-type ATPase [Clostridia bacterium]|nr:HAD-IC family P-type ATPase [Clostridia bacterium]